MGTQHSGKEKGRRRVAEAIARGMDIPSVAFANQAHIELEGNREAVIEGCKSVLEYDDGLIRLDLGKNSIRFMGNDLVIRSLSVDRAVITGYILSIEFII